MYKIALLFVIASTWITACIPSTAHAEDAVDSEIAIQTHFDGTSQLTTTSVLSTSFEVVAPAVIEYRQQLKNHKVPFASYWDKVAHCETGGNWQDKGNWGGGLGIAQSAWVNYGGREFASRPRMATRLQQIVIANRVAIFGFQTKHTYGSLEDRQANKPFFRPPVGFTGWGCIRNHIGKPRHRR